jgi:hypothetical protein
MQPRAEGEEIAVPSPRDGPPGGMSRFAGSPGPLPWTLVLRSASWTLSPPERIFVLSLLPKRIL